MRVRGEGEGAQRDEQKETLKSEQSTTTGGRRTERTGRDRAQSNESKGADGERRRREDPRDASFTQWQIHIDHNRSEANGVYTRFGNEGLALVRNLRVARTRVFHKKL